MNCTYRSIWNDKTATFVAVSENACGAGKKTSSRTTATAPVSGERDSFALKVLALSLLLSFGTSVYALPVGGVVAAGAASISCGVGSTTITQSTQNASLNWQSFNIAAGEAVRVVQPNSSSVILNRVLGADPSRILGNLSANGKVFLVNPNGILFGQGASVNVGALVASTLNLSDSDFMAGRYKFGGAGAGTVLNQGSINAQGGYVALLGATVTNDGHIVANLGTVALAAGKAITLDVAGDGLLHVAVDQGAVNALVQNGGLIQADGGQVLLTAQAAGGLLQSAVNNTGVIQAQTLENHNGTIRLLGDLQSGTVNLGGTLDVSGRGAGQTGGQVLVTAHHVGLFGAQIKADGDAGGGSVLVGGDYQGKNLSLQNASATYMSADAVISADAQTTGNGGQVVLWSDDSTRAYGRITARGGVHGGDGGLIETSGHNLDVAGIKVDTSAPQGTYGTWLLDPADVTISGAATSGGSIVAGVFTPGPGLSTANIAVADITTALLTTGVTINTANTGAPGAGSGDITIGTPAVAAPITWTAPTTLTLNAVRHVTVNLGSDITGTDGSLVVNAGGNIDVKAATKTTTGSLTYKAVGNVNMDAATTITTGTISAIAGGNVNVSTAMTVTTGSIILRGDNDGTGPGAVIGGTVAITCAANCITINDVAGRLRIRFNPASYATTGAEITNYGTKLTGGAALDAKAWVFGKGDNKLYDGITAATVAGLKPDIGGVAPAATLGTVTNANFDTKHVGTAKLITYNSTFADAVFDLFAPFGTAAGTYTTRADIFVRPLTVTAVTDSRVYNGTTSSVGVPTSTGLQVGDTLNGPLTQAYQSKNVMGTLGSTLVATGPYTVTDGNGGSNYAVTVNTAPGTITPLALVGSITAANKVYDGNNTATIATRTLANAVGTDTVSYTGGTAVFNDKNVADGKAVSGTGFSLAGADAGNYTVNPTANTIANITKAPLTIQADSNSKVFGDTFTPAATAFTLPVVAARPVAGEAVTAVTSTSTGSPPAASEAGSTYPIVITPGSATGTFTPSNYTITLLPGALTVTALPVPPVVVPPVVVPPVVVPPVVVPPAVVPPVVVPPVVVPPVVAPPVVVPPVVVPPVIVPPVDAPPVVELLAVDVPELPYEAPVVTPRGVAPTWLPVLTPPPIPPQLLTLVPPMVVAVKQPVIVLVPPQPQPPVVVVVPVETPPKIYVAPHRPRKQDRH